MPKAKEFKLQLRPLVPKFLKTIGHAVTPRSHIWYGEQELPFEKTPIVHVKMYRSGSMRFMFPCINPRVDFDMELDDEEGDRVHNGYDIKKKSFFLKKGDKEECFYNDDDYGRIECEEEERGIDPSRRVHSKILRANEATEADVVPSAQ